MARSLVFVSGNIKKTEEFVAIMGKSFPHKVNCCVLHVYLMCRFDCLIFTVLHHHMLLSEKDWRTA